MKANLILSTIRNLEYRDIAPFLESLRAAGSTARVHFFVSNVSPASLEKIHAAGATTEPFAYFTIRRRQPLSYLWPIWKPMMARRDFAGKCALGRWVLHLMSLRFILYHDFLQARPGQFENILLADCRDVYFQRDPFADNLGPGLHCFLEADTLRIGLDKWNRQMILKAFGPEMLAELAECPVSCAGTTIGDVDSILAYLRLMIETICRSHQMAYFNDQGVHNYVAHRRLVPGLQVHDNYTSSVFTAGCEPPEAIRFNDLNEVIRRDGAPYPILHQLDRHAGACAKLLAKLP